MKTEHNGIHINTACRAIKESRDKADEAYENHRLLVEQAIKQFDFADYEEFAKYWMENCEKFS